MSSLILELDCAPRLRHVSDQRWSLPSVWPAKSGVFLRNMFYKKVFGVEKGLIRCFFVH